MNTIDARTDSLYSRLSRLDVEERSVVADFLVATIESHGYARRSDLEHFLRIIIDNHHPASDAPEQPSARPSAQPAARPARRP